MKKFFTMFFVTLGVIFFLLILAGIYFYITDPLGLKPLLSSTKSPPVESSQTVENRDATTATDSTDNSLPLSPTQAKALETLGVDPASIPSSIPPEQEACFVEKLGAARVEEIKAGDSPTATDFLKAKSCVE